jgi:spermidine synthase
LEVASVPFLWVLPLTLYLISFILCFESERWYSRRYVMPACAVALGCVYVVLSRAYVDLVVQAGVIFGTFFLCAMVCHGELFARRPHPEYLTGYYLVIAGGGAAGGIFVAVLAPFIFPDYYELHLGLLACVVLTLFVLFTDPKSRFARGRPSWAWLCFLVGAGIYAALLLDMTQDEGGYRLAAQGGSASRDAKSYILTRERTFYGILRVIRNEANFKDAIHPIDILINGRTTHGFEYTDAELWSVATSYFDNVSGVGRLLSLESDGKPRRVGIVGLGVGTVAAYARPGDTFRFYEINEHVEPIARRNFHFLEQCRGKVEVVPGDARLSLEREFAPQNFDVLILDAFSSEAIPVHLLTREAFAVYLRHLVPNGVLAVHISNVHFDLRPVVEAAADAHRLSMVAIESGLTNYGGLPSDWELLSRSSDTLNNPWLRKGAAPPNTRRLLWTDDHTSLMRAWLSK